MKKDKVVALLWTARMNGLYNMSVSDFSDWIDNELSENKVKEKNK